MKAEPSVDQRTAQPRLEAKQDRANAGAFADTIDNSPRMTAQRALVAQLFGNRQAGRGAVQGQGTAQLAQDVAAVAVNRTGLPDGLKSGVESLSGHDLSDVNVHYNSSAPARLNAHAYAQGRDIHVAPGQERHLPHEAWHLVQQAEGRVQPTLQMQGGVAVNDDPGLEHEADVMGARALSAAPQAGAAVEPARQAASGGTAVAQAVWVDGHHRPLDDGLREKVWNDPLQELANFGHQFGMTEAATELHRRIAIVYESGNVELIDDARTGLRQALNSDQAWTIEKLLTNTLDHLHLPEDPMGDPEHAEDQGSDNPEEELDPGDLMLSEIGSDEQTTLAEALVMRHPGLYQQFQDLARNANAQPTPSLFLAWFNQGVLTRTQFKQLVNGGKPIQKARTPGALSYQAGYTTHTHGNFKDVTYKLDNLGSIDFGKVNKQKVWQNPMKPGSEVQLNKGSGKANYGITLSGTKIKIPGASRGQHFSMANRIMKNGFGSSSPTDWTWHHLTTYYKMVLVDRTVHAKHGHNGGVYVWK
ncbi:DUF4157 domain-containing protein [Massilia sp. CFBP9012]|uniref:eCIS core domain-containing protein n=1 Tax=Massilia sp. CFBP9012 TaxID=3096531 RepID=UPI002A6A2410|nr:DUF4157 domain-containing protein [Massilia sp. CFBP9012]MDY0975954.1 DUF4157 domain-containing protein [Massilia sp. CFBP9012]